MSNFSEKGKKNETQNPGLPDTENTSPKDESPLSADGNGVITVESLVTVNHNGIDRPKGTAWETTEKEARGLIECGAAEVIKTDEISGETKERTAGRGSLTAAPQDENAGRLKL